MHLEQNGRHPSGRPDRWLEITGRRARQNRVSASAELREPDPLSDRAASRQVKREERSAFDRIVDPAILGE